MDNIFLHGCAALRSLDEKAGAGYDDVQLQLLEDCLKQHLRDTFHLVVTWSLPLLGLVSKEPSSWNRLIHR